MKTNRFNSGIKAALLILISAFQITIFAQTVGWKLYCTVSNVNKLFSDGNTLWIASNEGLVKLDKTTMQPSFYDILNSEIPTSFITDIVGDGQGGLWGSTYNGIFHFDGTNWSIYDQSNTPELKSNALTNIFRDGSGKIWVTYSSYYSASTYVSEFDGTNWTSHNFQVKVYGVSQDNSGNILIGSDDGYFKFDGTNWTQITSANLGSASPIGISSVREDSKNNFWIATKSSGLLKYDGNNVTAYNISSSSIISNDLNGIRIDSKDNLWITFSSSSGFQKFDGTTWTTYSKDGSGLISNNITDVLPDGTNLWAASNAGFDSDGGLNFYNGSSWQKVLISNSGLPSNNLSSVAAQDIGGGTKFWIGTFDHGIASFDGTVWKTYDMSNSGLKSDYVNDIAVDRSGKVWIATTNGGLNVFNPADNGWIAYDQTNTGSNGLQSDIIDAIKIDTSGTADIIWAANSQGLVKFDGSNWTYYGTGQLYIPITKIDIDAEGNLWCGSSYGVVRFDGTNWTLWNSSNSNLRSDQINDIKATSLGIVAAVGFNGIAVFDPDSSDWVNYDNSNSPLRLDWVQSIAELPDTTSYPVSPKLSFKVLSGSGTGGTSDERKIEEDLVLSGQKLSSAQSSQLEILKTLRKSSNPLAVAAILLDSDALGRGELDWETVLIRLVHNDFESVFGTSAGLAVNENTSVPRDSSKNGMPKIKKVTTEQVDLAHRQNKNSSAVQVTYVPGVKGAFLNLTHIKSNGTYALPGYTSKILGEDIFLPPAPCDWNGDDITLTITPNFSVDGKQNEFKYSDFYFVDTYLSSEPLNLNLPINNLVASFSDQTGIIYDNAKGSEDGGKLHATEAGPKTNLKPDKTPVVDVYRAKYPSIDLNSSAYPAEGNFAGDLAACGPAGAANSLEWLDSTSRDFSLPQGKSLRDVMEELSFFMNRGDSSGVIDKDLLIGELDFIENYNLPLEVKFQSSFINAPYVNSTNGNTHARNFGYGNAPKPDWNFLKQQMQDREDVELNYHWFELDTNKTSGAVDTVWYGHCENVIGLEEYANGRKELTLKSDHDQTKPGGVELNYTGEVWKGKDGYLHFDNYGDTVIVTGIIADSPLPRAGRKTSAYLNEIYSNDGSVKKPGKVSAVIPEFVEVVVDTNISRLRNYRVGLYDQNGKEYDVKTLDQFTKGEVKDSMAVYYYNYPNGISNKGGVSLMYSGSPLPGQFISYGESFTADSGDATGLQSDSIGTASAGYSIALTGKGENYGDFSWNSQSSPTPGNFNNGQNIVTGMLSNNNVPLEYKLSQNYPNPFNPVTVIDYQLPSNGYVTLKVYDILGRMVKSLVKQNQPAGKYSVNFNAGRYASGVYFYQLRVHNSKGNDFISTKKMILLK